MVYLPLELVLLLEYEQTVKHLSFTLCLAEVESNNVQMLRLLMRF